jgi:hypothetical protein
MKVAFLFLKDKNYDAAIEYALKVTLAVVLLSARLP